MSRHAVPTRTLPDRPNLDQLRRQAKDLLDAFRSGHAEATHEVQAHYHGADPAGFALHDAQLVVARAYGFESWPKLKAFVDGITVRRVVDVIRSGDLDAVQSMIQARPEIVHLDMAENDEHRALHHAVLQRQPEIVRFLMQQGADARKGIWPHRAATTAFTLASERGDDEIVGIIVEEERRRSATPPDTLRSLAAAGPRVMKSIADVLLGRDAAGTARTAIAAGNAAWLRARHDEGLIRNGSGLVGHAVAVNRPDMLALLLDLGLDPDESSRVEGLEEVVPTWGEPLRACAIAGNLALAEILLKHGANANTNVYAATSAMFEARKKSDLQMIALLERHGGRLNPVGVAALGLVDEAARWLADDAAARAATSRERESTIAWELLWGAIESPSPEIVELVLRQVDWPRDDSRWHGILENGLYLGPLSDRARHLEAFRLVLDRSDPDVRSRRGTTLLHEIAASRGGLTADDRVAYATLLLDRGASLNVRDGLLESTPLGWACRWGRLEMVRLLLERGADAIEADAAPWASPSAWARKAGRRDVAKLLEKAGGRSDSPA